MADAGVQVVPPLRQRTFSAVVGGYAESAEAQLRDPLGILVIDRFRCWMY